MAITTTAQLATARARAIRCGVQTGGLSLGSPGLHTQMWTFTTFPGVGAIPTSAVVCTKDTPGAILKFNARDQTYIDSIDLKSLTLNTIVVADRLAHMGGLDATLTTPQTVNLTLPSDSARCAADGSDVEWYLTAFAQLGSTSVTATITYTNQSDVSGRTTTVTIPSTLRTQHAIVVTPGSTDLAIKSIQSVQLSATTGTAGNFGFVARKSYVSCLSSSGVSHGRANGLLIPIPDDICAELTPIVGNASSIAVAGEFVLVQG